MDQNAPASEALWHCEAAEDLLLRFGVDPRIGLDDREVETRRARHGRNVIEEKPPFSFFQLFIAQFTDILIVVLLAAAVISGVIGDAIDTVAILVIVALNAVIGSVQAFRAERAVAALKSLITTHVTVLREGKWSTLLAHELVPGDVVMMEAGDSIVADLRLLDAHYFQVHEAALTGESQPIDKHEHIIHDREIPLGDRLNMAFKGTFVTRGRARGLVVAIGMRTELGRIAHLLQQAGQVKTPLQHRLDQFSKRLAAVILVICVVLFMLGISRGENWVLMLLTAISLAVAAVPEALPAVVSISLAFGARTMSRHHALMRNLPAVESLGSVTYICSDKTGTLTLNKMHVECLLLDDVEFSAANVPQQGELIRLVGLGLALNNDVRRDSHGSVSGDPTETALFEWAHAHGFVKDELEAEHARLAELPFDAVRKRMTTLHYDMPQQTQFTKGAPESVIPLCNRVRIGAGEKTIDSAHYLTLAETMAAEGYRVMAFAYKKTAEKKLQSTDESDLCLLTLIGLIDPPRPEVPEAVEQAKQAGMIPVMITGDHPATAVAIARRLRLIDGESEVLTGAQLQRMSPQQLQRHVKNVRVYARVSPEQKIAIVTALQAQGEFVAMTGDGVNDAPALKRANMGVAMGLKGTDVAREASDMVLLDDNFATIVAAVREGRRIFDNIRKFIKYTMTSNSGEIWTLLLAPLLGLPIPLLPIHILWINLVTDGLPGLALASEPAERGIMQRPPRSPRESIFAHGMWQHMVWVGLLIGAVSLVAQAWAYHHGGHWQTMCFTVLAFAQLAHVLVIRSERDSLFRLGLLSNKAVLGAVMLTIVLQLLIIYLPWLNPIFNTAPLTAVEMIFCFVLSTVIIVAVEIEKYCVRRGWIYQKRY